MQNIQVGDMVRTQSINEYFFTGTVLQLDKYGFAIVGFEMSESRIQLSKLTKVRADIVAIIEANKMLQASGINTKAKLAEWTLNQRKGIKCLICNKRDESANNGGKFTCDSCRSFLISNGHYGASDEKMEAYAVRMGEVLDMPSIPAIWKFSSNA